MPTLRFPRPEDLRPEDREILQRVAKRRGTTVDGLSDVWKAQAYWPPLLEANIRESSAAFLGTGGLPALTKQAMHVGVSMSNACDYWLSSHVVAVLRLGATEQGITEILAVAEHVTSIAAAAEGLRLRADVPGPASGPANELVDWTRPPRAESEPVLAEIARWTREVLAVDRVPSFWRTFALRPRLLEAVWQKHLLVLGADEIGADVKAAVALAVAMNAHSDYWTGYFDQLGRVSYGFDDETVVDIAGAVIHYKSFNTIAHGMMLEAPHRDIVAKDFAPDTPTHSE